jgi:hypothetical protein
MKNSLIGFVLMLFLVCATTLGSTKADNKSIGTRTVAEGERITFNIVASDPDGDVVNISAETLPVSATLSPTVEDTGIFTSTFSWTPNFDQAGVIDVWMIAEDIHGAQDWGKVIITITNTNRPPVLGNI